MYTWIILIVLTLLVYNFVNQYISYALLFTTIYIVLKDLHIIGESKFNSGTIKKSVVLFKKVTGAYKDSQKHFFETCSYLQKFPQLQGKYEYNKFGYYLDDPKKKAESECRSCIGVLFTPSDKDMQINKDLVNYLCEKGWYSFELPASPAIVSRFQLVSYSFLLFAIIRFYKDLERNLCDKEFISKMRFDPNKIPGIMEVCKPNMIEFYVPTGNQEKFGLWEAQLISDEKRE